MTTAAAVQTLVDHGPTGLDGGTPLGSPHAALAEQQAFLDACTRVMPRAGANGQRLVGALFLVLQQHAARPMTTTDGLFHLTCTECRPDGRTPAEQYPCPTAEHAYWALHAALS